MRALTAITGRGGHVCGDPQAAYGNWNDDQVKSNFNHADNGDENMRPRLAVMIILPGFYANPRPFAQLPLNHFASEKFLSR